MDDVRFEVGDRVRIADHLDSDLMSAWADRDITAPHNDVYVIAEMWESGDYPGDYLVTLDPPFLAGHCADIGLNTAHIKHVSALERLARAADEPDN